MFINVQCDAKPAVAEFAGVAILFNTSVDLTERQLLMLTFEFVPLCQQGLAFSYTSARQTNYEWLSIQQLARVVNPSSVFKC